MLNQTHTDETISQIVENMQVSLEPMLKNWRSHAKNLMQLNSY